MALKRFTFILGLAFLSIGILGFVPALVSAPHHTDVPVDFVAFHGRLLGLFPVNAVHNVVHILFGLWALYASSAMDTSRVFCRANAIIYGGLVIMGFFPALNTVFGLMPVHSHDIWLHAVIAGAAAYFGFVWEPGRFSVTSPTTPSRATGRATGARV